MKKQKVRGRCLQTNTDGKAIYSVIVAIYDTGIERTSGR